MSTQVLVGIEDMVGEIVFLQICLIFYLQRDSSLISLRCLLIQLSGAPSTLATHTNFSKQDVKTPEVEPLLPKVKHSLTWQWAVRIRRTKDAPLTDTAMEHLFVSPAPVSVQRM